MEHWEQLVINEEGHLMIGGCDSVLLAERFGTPLYIMEEKKMRDICRHYYSEIKNSGMDGLVCYAGKAFLNTAMCRIMESEDMGLDVVSAGELYTALNAHFPMDRVYYHGNTKTTMEIDMAVSNGVHAIVADNLHEIEHIIESCGKYNKTQGVYVRIKPCIEAHTHEYIKTARDDAKFGLGINDGDAMKAVKKILNEKCLELKGIHCHIGSQIFELEPYKMTVDVMTGFILKIKQETGFELPEVNFGGGYGINYVVGDAPFKPWVYVKTLIDCLKECCGEKGLKLPKFVIEPGRSIVGEAGTTLYTVSSLKEIEGIVNYVNTNGSLADNIRPTLYNAEYTCIMANRANEKCDYIATVAGRTCESGDLLIKNATIPKPKSGDILAVFSTGAYNYAMASNYNRLGIPAVVLVNGGSAELMVRRQELKDIISYDEMPSWLEQE